MKGWPCGRGVWACIIDVKAHLKVRAVQQPHQRRHCVGVQHEPNDASAVATDKG